MEDTPSSQARERGRVWVDSHTVPSNDPKSTPPPARGSRTNAPDRFDVDPNDELSAFEDEIVALKIAFEQFFMGIDRKSPELRSAQLGEQMRRLKNSGRIRTTAARFRMQQIQTRFQTYERMWKRTLQQMEAGTYRRDLARMKRKKTADLTEQAPTATKPTPDLQAKEQPHLSESQIRQIFDTYIVARKRTNEPTAGVTLEGLSATLRKQVPQLMKKHEASAIDFKVVIKD